MTRFRRRASRCCNSGLNFKSSCCRNGCRRRNCCRSWRTPSRSSSVRKPKSRKQSHRGRAEIARGRPRRRGRGQRGHRGRHAARHGGDEHARRQHGDDGGIELCHAALAGAQGAAGARHDGRGQMGPETFSRRGTGRQNARRSGHGPHRHGSRQARHRLRHARHRLRSLSDGRPRKGHRRGICRRAWTKFISRRISSPSTCR